MSFRLSQTIAATNIQYVTEQTQDERIQTYTNAYKTTHLFTLNRSPTGVISVYLKKYPHYTLQHWKRQNDSLNIIEKKLSQIIKNYYILFFFVFVFVHSIRPKILIKWDKKYLNSIFDYYLCVHRG